MEANELNLTAQIAKHFREVHFGGNWTTVSLQEQLADVTWEQAITQVHAFNTIATLVNHTGYYVTALIGVLKGEGLNAKDEYSFAHPAIRSHEDWEDMLDRVYANAEEAALLIERLPAEFLDKPFTDEKYGNYYRNIHGIIEHLYYHLGQIVLIKKIQTVGNP